jgi:hypothetical protein
MSIRSFGLALILACAPAAAQAADLSQVGPLASAHAVLAARPTLHEPALHLVYKVTGGDRPGTLTADIAADFIAIRQGDETTIYDYALRRIIRIDGTRHFGNSSLYAFADFLLAETYNRRMQHRLLGSIGAGGGVVDAFWVQSELHVMQPEDGVPDIARAEGGGVVRFSYGGKDVADYALSAQPLEASAAPMMAKFLRLSTRLHPNIIAEIAQSGRLPQRLDFDLSPLAKTAQAHWDLQTAAQADAVYPLSATDVERPPSNADLEPPLDALDPVMRDAVARRAPGLRQISDYRAAIEAALAGGKPFQAALLAFELTEQYGVDAARCGGAPACHELRDIFLAARADARMEMLAAALQPNKDRLADAIGALRKMRRDDLQDVFVLDEFLANLEVEAGDAKDAGPLFAAAIEGNPYLAGYYKDLGDRFRYGFEPTLAWYCYDVGRLLPGGPNANVIGGIGDHEAHLVAAMPDFF